MDKGNALTEQQRDTLEQTVEFQESRPAATKRKRERGVKEWLKYCGDNNLSVIPTDYTLSMFIRDYLRVRPKMNTNGQPIPGTSGVQSGDTSTALST